MLLVATLEEMAAAAKAAGSMPQLDGASHRGEQGSTWISRSFFLWVTPLIESGFKRKLLPEVWLYERQACPVEG